MKSLRDDSLPIDVTRDDPVHRHGNEFCFRKILNLCQRCSNKNLCFTVSNEEKQQFVQSNNYCIGENFDNDNFGFG